MRLTVVLLAGNLLILLGASGGADAAPPSHSSWQMTFSDEFNRGAMDLDKWAAVTGPTPHCASRRTENVEIRGGVCRLVTRKKTYLGKQWTEGHLFSRTFTQQYGYFEARMKITAAPGIDCNFWLTADRGQSAVEPFCLDVAKTRYPNTNLTRVGDLLSGQWYGKLDKWTAPHDLSKGYHLYAVEWNEKELIWYFDGREFRRLPNTSCHREVRVHLSTALTSWAGEVTDALDGARAEVDYVRVYRKLARPPNWSDWHDGIQ